MVEPRDSKSRVFSDVRHVAVEHLTHQLVDYFSENKILASVADRIAHGYNYRLLRPIGYCRFELNVWVWRSFFGLIRSPKTGLFLTFWKVTRRKSERSGRLQKNTFLLKNIGKNSKNCLSVSNCVISNPLEQKKNWILRVSKKCLKPYVSSKFLFHRIG